MTGVRIVSCRSANVNMFQMTCKFISVSSEDFGLLKIPMKEGEALGIWMICTRFKV